MENQNKPIKKRIFIGTFIQNKDFLDYYYRIVKESKKFLFAKWVEPYNLHFTYKFIGNVYEKDVENIKKELQYILDKEVEVDIKISGVDVFYKDFKPVVFYFKMFSEELKDYKIHIEESLKGYKELQYDDHKKFIPHITIGRIKRVIDERKLFSFIEKEKNKENLSINSIKIHLIESKLTPQGPLYKIV